MQLTEQMKTIARGAREAVFPLREALAETRSEAIRASAAHIRSRKHKILAANAADVAEATSPIDRLRLDEERVESMASSLEVVADLPDRIGETMERWTRPNGLDIARVRTPIGAIGMIYESRPNVTSDAAGICLRSGNVLVLRPGSESLRSALAIHEALVDGIRDAGLPDGCVQVVPVSDRDAVGMMLEGLFGTLDLIIPRGGKALVERVNRDARIPTLGHLEGVCHTYVHASADLEMAVAVVANAKMRRVSICGATETLLVDREIAPRLLPRLVSSLEGCEFRGDAESRAIVDMAPAAETDWAAEYLEPILAVRVVADLDEAAAHIAAYGTGHTDAIIAEDAGAAETFLRRVDSGIVMWNASTQFADGGEFGFGAEIGIATGRLHARGPVGADQLTMFKYAVRGTGQLR